MIVLEYRQFFLFKFLLLHSSCFFFLVIGPRPISTLFPYTTLFRSHRHRRGGVLRFSGGETRDRELQHRPRDRKSTRLNSSHTVISYAVFCLKKKNQVTHK